MMFDKITLPFNAYRLGIRYIPKTEYHGHQLEFWVWRSCYTIYWGIR